MTDIEGRIIERTNDRIRLEVKVPEGAEPGPRTLVIKDADGNIIARRSNMVRIVSAAKPKPAPEDGRVRPAADVGNKLASPAPGAKPPARKAGEDKKEAKPTSPAKPVLRGAKLVAKKGKKP